MRVPSSSDSFNTLFKKSLKIFSNINKNYKVENIFMEWKYNEKDFIEVPKNMEGFVYLITNLTNEKKYVGKKHFWTRQKDKKTGRRKKKESDWRNYYGSCEELKEDIKLLGKENFLRIDIL